MGDNNKEKLPPHHRNRPNKFAYLDEAYKPESDPKKPKHLGTMNGWGGKNKDPKLYPKEYKFCIRKRPKNPHKPTEKIIGKCLTEYYCKICNIFWVVDSSD